ncbi:NAD(P)-dependent oxidoreductase [Tessaracoccus sp. MC1865]|uniref:NAD(P)-binding domain-containing protein n=1 Tax=Tessaracoccus sp. MC1865 TaxID=2760310 RepID=UPI0015FF1400|nr:NAD(P)-binding domain-containing protein [Tessaracoccus sp. MC1865]MBB1482606.1 NAD(P)-dependent oxidoreductase [Tessaracoccus sp. MC1865]QTO37942.1 NAD(P)-dependent oxidoreductase [Tessaracoccus sp. MC1865]
MICMIGLGAMGAGIASRWVAVGRQVVGLERDERRAAAWQEESGATAWVDFDSVPWNDIHTVAIAVRLGEHVRAALEELTRHIAGRNISVFVFSTLGIQEAPAGGAVVPSGWALHEVPVSGGPQACVDGTLTVLHAGPALEPEDEALLADISNRVYFCEEYGQPATYKLLNNCIGAFNAATLVNMLDLARSQGVSLPTLLDIVGESSGQSWMSDNFTNFHYELLLKDVGLLKEGGAQLPPSDLGDLASLSHRIEVARTWVREGRS